MKVRITKSFAGYRVGQVFDWGDGMARIYIGRGMAEPLADGSEAAGSEQMVAERSAPPVIEEQMVEPKVERATVQHRRKTK